MLTQSKRKINNSLDFHRKKKEKYNGVLFHENANKLASLSIIFDSSLLLHLTVQKQPEKYNDRVHKSAHFLNFKNLIASPTSSVCAVKERRELKVGGEGGGSKAKEKGNMKGERRVEGGYVWKRKSSRYKTAYIYKHG